MFSEECKQGREKTYVSEILKNVIEEFRLFIIITKLLDSFLSYQVLGDFSP